MLMTLSMIRTLFLNYPFIYECLSIWPVENNMVLWSNGCDCVKEVYSSEFPKKV